MTAHRLCSILIAAFIFITTCPGWTETPADLLLKQMINAQQLDAQGRSGDAMAILEPLLRDVQLTPNERIHGIALNIQGSIYRNMDRYDQARRSYEESIHILSLLPNEQMETASSIDNLGGVEELTGQLDAAKALRLRALHLYEKVGNHAGMALASSNLTNVALKQHNLSAARKWMKRALEELPLTIDINEDNLAAIYTVKGVLNRSERNFTDAIKADQRAIVLLTEECGPSCPKLGPVYTLRAEAYGLAGNYQQSEADFQKAFSLLKANGQNSRSYLMAKLAYASMLQASGSQSDASRMGNEARIGLENLDRMQCNGCTITAESFR